MDGDVRDTIPKELIGRCACLPGDTPIERSFRDAATKSPVALSGYAGNDAAGRILSSIEGLEIHDWYHDLAAELGLNRGQLFPIMFRLWIDMEGNEALAKATADALAELIEL